MSWLGAQEYTTSRDCSSRSCPNTADGADGVCSYCRDLLKRILSSRKALPLTPIELQVLKSAASGLSAAEAAKALGKGEQTVKDQRRVVIAKLKARNMTHAVAVGFRRGWIA